MARYSTLNVRSYNALSWLFGPVFARIARAIELEAPEDAAILDVGCGPGHLAIRLAKGGKGRRVTGADLEPAMVEQAVANAGRAFGADDPAQPRFVVADVADLPFGDGAFDLVVSTFSLHHWSDPAAGLTEIYRVLQPGGRALVWDLGGGLRADSRGSRLAEIASATPFGSLVARGRWGLGPIVLAERYDLVKPAT